MTNINNINNINNTSKKIIGIDLGTSTSEAACLIDGKPTIIPDLKGDLVIPSIVYISDKDAEVKVGVDAQNYALLEPENTVLEIKRLMGSKNSLKLGKKYLKPEEISGEILKYIKNYVEHYLGEPVESAVITVPAYFTNEQRVATKVAGELAGFQVKRIINEPTAAALAYGLDHMKDEKYLLVYDFGGGTLDVTVLEMFQGVLDVRACSGNNRLGGKDFDQALMDKLIKDFKKEQNISLDQNKKALARLKSAAEKVKIELSLQEKAVIDLPFLGQKEGKPYGLHREITRGDFEKLIAPLIHSTLDQIDAALADAKLNPEDMDTILLIGGSTKIPLVKDVLKKKFRREPKHEINPDEAVALGAAIQGGIITGELSEEQDIIITDVCPFTLGIECAKDIGGMAMPGMFDPLIKRNTTIPVSTRKKYQTFVDDQEAVQINVFQGERERAYDNNLIGNFMIEGIPQGKAGAEKIEVEFSYDINGILEVKAQVISSGQDGRISIDTREMEIEEVLDVETGWKKSKRSKKVKSLIKKGEKMLNDIFVASEVKEELEAVLYELKYALTIEDDLFINRYEEELTELLYQAED